MPTALTVAALKTGSPGWWQPRTSEPQMDERGSVSSDSRAILHGLPTVTSSVRQKPLGVINKQDFGRDLFRFQFETHSIERLQDVIQAIGIFTGCLRGEIELVIEEADEAGFVIHGRIDLVGVGVDQSRHGMTL